MQFSTVAEAGSQRSGCQPGWGLAWGPSSGRADGCLWLCPQGGWGERSRLLTRTLIQSWGSTLMTLSPPKPCFFVPSPWGLAFNMNLWGWGHKHLVHSRSLGMRGQDPAAPGPEQGWKLGLPLSRRHWRGAVGSRLSPQQPAFSGAHVGAGAAAGRGRSLGRGQCCGMRQGTAPPRGDEHVPGAWGGRCAGGHSPPAPPGSLLAVLGQRLGGLG